MSEQGYLWWNDNTLQWENVDSLHLRREEQEHFVTPAERMAKEIVQEALVRPVYYDAEVVAALKKIYFPL